MRRVFINTSVKIPPGGLSLTRCFQKDFEVISQRPPAVKRRIPRPGGAEVLIGAGVNAVAISRFRSELPAARAFHMSGKREVESRMRFRREGVPMGLPGLDEWHIQQTDPEAVKAARMALYG